MNKIKYNLFLLIIFVILLTLIAVVQTYALFETNANADTDFDIGEWVIKVNDTDITQTRTLTLNQFTYTSGSHTQNGYFAPGSTFSFDLVIDASESEVSVEYLIDIDDSDILEYPNINFTVTNLDTNVTETATSYDGIILLNDLSREARLRLNLVWNNETQYDESDTSLIGQELAFDITANFKQYISE